MLIIMQYHCVNTDYVYLCANFMIHAEKHCPTMILKSDLHMDTEVRETSAVSAGARQHAREVHTLCHIMDQCHACGGRRGPRKHRNNVLELPARLSVRLCLPCQHEIAANEPNMFWKLGPICGHKYYKLQEYVSQKLADADRKAAAARSTNDRHRRLWDEESTGTPNLVQLCARVIIWDGASIRQLAGVLPEGHPPWLHMLHEYNYTHRPGLLGRPGPKAARAFMMQRAKS
jgi:hypothetical protein